MASLCGTPATQAPVGHAARRRQLGTRCSCQLGEGSSLGNSRRDVLQQAALLALPLLSIGSPALAAEEGNPLRAILRAPADFYRSRQQLNGGAKILAPIRASRARLEAAAAALAAGGSAAGSSAAAPALYTDVLAQLRAASLNCYLYEAEGGLGGGGLESRASLLQQQLPLSDPCTFRILHKNALTLVADTAVEREADDSLDALVRSFQLLDVKLDQARQGNEGAAAAVPGLLQQCVDANIRFERAIKSCIGLADA